VSNIKLFERMAAIVDDVALFNKVLSQDEILDLAK
jgi:hypothetical protein